MKTAIVTCIDANYVEAAAVFIESFSENYHINKELDIICVMPEEDREAFKWLSSTVEVNTRLNLKLKTVSSKSKYKWMHDAFVSDRWQKSPAVWYRVMLGSILADYDKAIYFDPDILIVDNVQPILDYPMYGKLMAVMDVTGAAYLYGENRGETAWFSTGVLIIDLNWWRESNIEETLKQDIISNGAKDLVDEHLLNKYLKDVWYPLPLIFNFYAFNRDRHGAPDYDSTFLNPAFHKHAIVIHFAGPTKPWNYKETTTKTDKSLIGKDWIRRRNRVRNRQQK